MMINTNVIFLYADCVLNNEIFFVERYSKVLELCNKSGSLCLRKAMLDIDLNKLKLLKGIINKGAYVVVTSSWKE